MLKVKYHHIAVVLTTLMILSGLLAAGTALADEDNHRGLFIGINAGFGDSSVGYKIGSRSIFTDSEDGAMGGLRFGYAFSPKIALSLEGAGIGQCDRDTDDEGTGWGVGVLAATWHPCGKGFFVRAGLGGGGGTFDHPVTGEKTTVEDRGAALFSLGYDWYIGDRTSLGISFDNIAIDAGGATWFDEDSLIGSGFTLQFNWYL